MNIPGMTPEIQNRMNLWCAWCARNKRFIPFEEWLRHVYGDVELETLLGASTSTNDEFMVRIRLRGTDKYIGLKDPTYALVSDGGKVLITDAHWFVPKNRAKTWPNVSSLRKFCGMATGRKWSESTFSQFEAVMADGTTKSLEDVLR